MNIAIIGGGVSGVTAAIKLAEQYEVTIFEKNNRLLKKLLVTGNGRCNFSNIVMQRNNFHGNKTFLDTIFNESKFRRGETFLSSIGVVPYKDERGRIYPLSLQAQTVVDLLLKKIEQLNIKVIYDTNITSIKKIKNKFFLNSDGNHSFDKVILSPGSMSYPEFGTDGSQYKLATSLGHKKTKLLPGIGSLIANVPFSKELNGLKLNVKLSFKSEKNNYSKIGDLLFNKNGVSGNVIFETSSIILRNNVSYINVDFLYQMDMSSLLDTLHSREKTFSDYEVDYILYSLIHKRLINVIMKLSGIDRQKKVKEINDSEIKTLANLIKNFKIDNIEGGSWKQSQVTVGGIDLDDIKYNFESKLIDNLYFAGEYLDCDGDCGGYNLTFALVSALELSDGIINENFKK